jgi:Uma2 family endonuclease
MQPSTTRPTDEELFQRYGWRFVRREDGELVQVPLTLEDCLHPQEGDHVSANSHHNDDCVYLKAVFDSRRLTPPFAIVSHDLLVDWGLAGMRNHSPDVAVFTGLGRDPRPTGLLRLARLGGRCDLIVEVVSPDKRDNDVVHKFDHYFRIGIPFYVLIDQEQEDGPRTLRAYRHTPAGYVEEPPDAMSRVPLPPVGLLLGLREDGRAVCFDAATGEEIEDLSGQLRAREEEQRAREKDRERFSQYREDVDRAMTEQVTARQTAERDAEKQRKEADKQREEAENQRRAREQADKLIRELQEKLRLLQGGGGDPPA